MLARPLTCEAGSNISLAVMHQLEEGDASIHLLEVKKATTIYFRRRQHPQILNSTFIIGLRSCTCTGRATTSSSSKLNMFSGFLRIDRQALLSVPPGEETQLEKESSALSVLVPHVYSFQVGRWPRKQPGGDPSPCQVARSPSSRNKLCKRQRGHRGHRHNQASRP